MPLSKYVAEKRKRRNLTQKELAELLYYTPQALSRFESVDSAFPLDQADALCKALDCCLDEVVRRQIEDTHYAPLPFELSELGEYLSAQRRFRSISQEEMAEECDISTRSLRNYESGKSMISLQTLDVFCSKLGILPSELSKPLEVSQQMPPRQRRRWILPFSLTGVGAILIVLVVVLVVNYMRPMPVDDPSSTSLSVDSMPNSIYSEDSEPIVITSEVESSSEDHIGKYGLEIHAGVPNFLQVSYPTNRFTKIGEAIVITLSDAYDETTVHLNKRDEWDIQPVLKNNSMEFSFERVGPNQIEMKLLAGENGGGTPLNISLYDAWHYNLGFFYYRTEEPVYLEKDVDHAFPVDGGKVHCDLKSEVNVRLSDSPYVQFMLNASYNGLYNTWSEECVPYYIWGVYYHATCRFSSHNWPATLSSVGNKGRIELPKSIEVNDVYIYGMLQVAEDISSPKRYSLEPLHIHILRY